MTRVVHIEQLQEVIRDRPGTALVLTAGGALLLGFAAGHWYSKRVAEHRKSALRRHLNENGLGLNSGTSTPLLSTGGTPRVSQTGEVDDKAEYSLALVYRVDLPTGKGRFATLCAQAALGQFKKLWRAKSEDLRQWERTNAVKVCLQVENEDHLLRTEQAAREAGLPTFTVKDTQNAQRVRAVMALGPAESSRIRSVTHDLKLLL